MQFEHYDAEQGLPNNQSEAIFRDSYGFLWVGTYNGLSKYDGTRFQNYPVIDSSIGIKGNAIFSIFEDSKRQIWIGSNKGLKRYNRYSDSFTTVLNETCIQDITEKQGQLWVTSFDGVFVFDIKTTKQIKRFTITNGLSNNILSKATFDKKGDYWVGTQNDGLIKINPKSGNVECVNLTIGNGVLMSNHIKTITVDNDGLLWIGTTDKGLFTYNVTTKKCIPFTDDLEVYHTQLSNFITCIFVDSKNNIWFCQNGSLNKYDKKRKLLNHFYPEQYNTHYIQTENVCFVTEDQDENIWIGSYGTGIFCLSKEQNKFHILSSIPEKKNSLKGNIVTSFVEMQKGEILLGIDYKGLQYFNPNTNCFNDFGNTRFATTHILSLIKDNDNVWCSTWGEGLYKINVKTNTISNYIHDVNNPKTVSNNNIKTATIIDNTLWVGTWGDGLEAFDLKGNVGFLKHQQCTNQSKVFTSPSWINKIMKDSKNRVWIATMSGLLVKQGNKYKKFINKSDDNASLIDDVVYSLFEDSKHQIWALTNKGIDKYIESNATFQHFSADKKLPSNPMSMLEDDRQNLWISSLNGIYLFNEQTGKVRRFSSQNGLTINEYNSNSAFKTSDGLLFFGGKTGFVYFNPEQLKPTFGVPQIAFRRVYVDNELKHSPEQCDTFKIQYSNSVIQIEIADLKDIVSNFAAFEYSFDEKNNWKTIDETHKITFSNKTPGTYVIRVKATYDNQKYSQKVLTLIVLPPWWMTWWFRFLCLSIFLFLLYSIFKIRLKVIKNQNELLTKLVKEKTSDLVDANEELHQQNTAIAEKEMLLQIRHDELQKTNVTKDKLFSIISQDLKTHFTGIMENSMNLHRSKMIKNEKERQTYIDSIYSSSKQINAQIDLFLHWSKSQTKSLQGNPIEIDVESLIRENVSLFYSKAMTKQLDLQFSLEHKFDAFADIEMITIVLRNLINNAIKFTPKQGKINIQTSNTADYTVIQVIDNGLGMSQEEINAIYTKSINESKPGTEQELGTGLGLVICRDFLNLNKAKIEISSKIGEGTNVSIFLPKGNVLQQATQSENAIVALPSEFVLQTVDEESESKQRLLIVEDNDEIMQYIVGIFEPYYIIETAVNGEEGFAKALASIPDLVITDINMPIRTGLEMCLQLQANPILHHVPVIILTAYNNLDMQTKGLQAGAFDYVVKPFDSTILFLKVKTVLESRTKFKDYLKKQFIQQPSSVLNETPDDKFMLMMHNVLEKQYSDAEFSVEKFATEMGYSRSQFFRKLKAIIDTTPLEYLKVFRLNKAKEMLETGKWTVSNVAYDVGFNDPHYFGICFKSHFGFPPNHFTKK